MKKLFFLALVSVLLLTFSACGETQQPKNERWDVVPMVKVNGKVYRETGVEDTYVREDGLMDGEITSQVSSNETPRKNDQSNFGTGYGYQYGTEGTLYVCIDGRWWVFKTEAAIGEGVQ